MKIAIEVSEETARMLRSYASLGRYCDAVLRLCEKAESEDLDVEEVRDATEELKPALMEIHMTLRQKFVDMGVKALWRQL